MLALRITLISTLILAMSACAGGGGGSNKGGSSTESPRILSVPSTTATVGAIYRYDCTAIGTPSPTLSFSGLPSWMMSDSRTIWGTPQAQHVGSAGPITVTADNGTGSVATQIFSVIVSGSGGGSTDVPPQITSSPGTTAIDGFLYQYNVITTGTPAPSLSASALPAWLTLNGNSLSGTPTSADIGQTQPITLTATNGALPDATQTFSITVTAAPTGPVLSLSAPAMINEGSSGTVQAVFTVMLAPGQPPIPTVSVDFTTTDGAATAPADFAAQSGTLTFTPGETSKQITIDLNPDTLDEEDESFGVLLTNPINATLAASAAQTVIVDDDAEPEVSVVSSAAHAEPATGSNTLSIGVALRSASGKTIQVDYASFDGTATAPADYTAVSGTLTFMPGEALKSVDVLIVGDGVAEGSETLGLGLSNPTNAVLATSSVESFQVVDPAGAVELWGAGANTIGILDPSHTNALVFPQKQFSQLNGATEVFIEDSSGIALMPNGRVWTWGPAGAALGDPAITNGRANPASLSSLTDIVRIEAREGARIAIDSTGTAWGWGASGSVFGLGHDQTVFEPTQLPINDVSQYALGFGTTYALKNDGSVWSAGQGLQGQLGNGTFSAQSSFGAVTGLPSVRSIRAGLQAAYAISTAGELWVWGANSIGQLGNGSTADVATPQKVSGLSNVLWVEASSAVFAKLANGDVYSWGSNFLNVQGSGSTSSTPTTTPILRPDLSHFDSIHHEFFDCVGVEPSGAVWVWGQNSWGELGLGHFNQVPTPTRLGGLVALSARVGQFTLSYRVIP